MIEKNHNVQEFTVSELSNLIKIRIEDNFAFIRVRGEISGLKVATSGHAYFKIKDERSILDAVSWKGVFQNLKIRPEDGMEVICTGSISTYPSRSTYQMQVSMIEPAGQGALMLMFEKLKQKLQTEGLFASERKKKIPYIPNKIGIITSETGAVIRDMIHRFEDRFPILIELWPVLVQGDKAAEQIVQAIRGFNERDNPPDLLIIARGGGSLEDLWAFNEEILVKAVAASKIATISAVGHETDYTLCDFAADVRAPTPTAAAEMAVPVRSELLKKISELERKLILDLRRIFDYSRQRCDEIADRSGNALPTYLRAKKLSFQVVVARMRSPMERISHNRKQYSNLKERLTNIELLGKRRDRLVNLSNLLRSVSYQSILDRGYAMILKDGNLIRDPESINEKDDYRILLHGGDVRVKFKHVR